jgi:two-component system phosphate regulon sensor histidine kinase PhoR
LATEANIPKAEEGGSLLQRAERAVRGLWARPTPRSVAPAHPQEPSLQDYEPLLRTLPDPAMLLDPGGRIAAVNEAARKRWAAEPGVRFSAVLRHPPLLDAVQGAMRDHGVRTIEFVSGPDPGEHFQCTVAPLGSGRAQGVAVLFRDQTAQIAAERMRVDFVANASHELRTPLTALSMLIETIAGPARDNEADRARFLRMMQAQADRMRRLIDDLLALSRIELDEHIPPSGQADLVAAAREAADSASPVAAQRDVRIEVRAAIEPVMIIADRFQIAQVAQNLIDNAVKFSPSGGTVTVELGVAANREEAMETAGRRWANAGRISLHTPPPGPLGRRFGYLRVVDKGQGIAIRHLPRLGERFFRVEREKGSDRGGTGLGLAIVKHIVSRHRGGLLVESELDAGSAFAVYFECAE